MGNPAGLTCWGMKELENVTTDQKKIPQLRITFLLKVTQVAEDGGGRS